MFWPQRAHRIRLPKCADGFQHLGVRLEGPLCCRGHHAREALKGVVNRKLGWVRRLSPPLPREIRAIYRFSRVLHKVLAISGKCRYGFV